MIAAILFYGITGAVAFYLLMFVTGVLMTDFSVREVAKTSAATVAALTVACIVVFGLIYLVTWARHHVTGVPADLDAWWGVA
mgnify:CR=1 FL=1